jgi:hypothetical protein
LAETRLQSAYRQRLERIRTRTLRLVTSADTPNTTAFVQRVVPLVLASQEATVAAADAYLSAEAGLATGSSTEPWALDPSKLIGVKARRGDFLEDVYGRNHRADASSFAERMAREVNTDITLADRGATYVHTEGDSRISGYRRVLSTGKKNCPLCVVASDRLYHKSDLRPIHEHCGCTTQPIYNGNAKGWTKPSKALINDLYERAGSTSAHSLTRIRVRDLPEVRIVDSDLGPTLIAA